MADMEAGRAATFRKWLDKKNTEHWYRITVYAVMSIIGAIVGSYAYVTYRKNMASRPNREANRDLLTQRLVPRLRAETTRIPDKSFSFIVSVADKTEDGSEVPFTRATSVYTLGPEGEDRIRKVA